jgi:hypothetical protein
MLKSSVWRFGCLLLPFLATLFCFAQMDLAGLNGTVSDNGGRRLAGAHIIAVQLATGLRRETVSSASGTYAISDLPIGVYRVTYAAPGFQDEVVDDLEQTLGHTRTLAIALSVAGITQRVEVSDDSSQFDKTSATMGSRTEPEPVKELPLNGRNWSTLTALVPGAVDAGAATAIPTPEPHLMPSQQRPDAPSPR